MEVRIEITESLYEEIENKFKKESSKVFDLIETLKTSPSKGKTLGSVGGIVIKEIKYQGFRFYFMTDGFKLKMLGKDSLVELLIKFVRMSDKKSQQKTIEEIKHILRTIGPEGLL